MPGYNPRVSQPAAISFLAPTRRRRVAREPWLLAAAASVVLAATWVRAPSAPLALLLSVLLGLVLWLTRGVGRDALSRRLGFALALGGLLLSAARYHVDVRALDRRGEEIRQLTARQAGAALAEALNKEVAELQRLTAAALAVPEAPDAAFVSLAQLVPPGGSRAVIVARGGRPVAWSGRLLVPLDSLAGPTGLVGTPFYLVAYAVAQRGNALAVATTVLHAEPPATALTASLAADIAADFGASGFGYAPPEAVTTVPDATLLQLGGAPVLAARAVMPSVEALRNSAWERVLPRAGLALASMLLLLLAVAWRRATGLRPRFIALAVGLAVPAILPLSVFSNLSTWFDPTFYLVRSGWRFTANAGALALTAALLLLGLLSARRARPHVMTRAQSWAAVLLVAGLGPFLLRELAGGLEVPSIGVPLTLWLSWQITLFLSAVTVLLLGVTAGHGALGRDRGLPLWAAPTLAILAALAAPFLLEAPGRFPPAYTALWVVAIAALAITRRARAIVIPVALVAACGATTLIWSSTVRERVELAVRDVQGLARPDGNAAILLDRFTETLDPVRASRTRVELLAQLARTELAGAEYPTEISSWADDGSLMADLVIGRAPGVTAGVNLFAAEAQRTGVPTLTEVRGDPGIHSVLAVPHADGTATTVVVAPRSRLVAQDPFGAFIGFSPPPAPEPPYQLRLGDVTPQPPSAPTARGAWTRTGSELHGDWLLPSAGGMSRQLHALVELRSFDVLLTRGVLLVLVDLIVLGLIWLLIVSADGALPRWWRRRRRDVLSSYRSRLTAALFVCFLVPSLLFGFWSFRRLQADDRQARDLLVRETLRGVASTDSVQLSEAAARFDTPLFLYAQGLLVGTSDPLLDAIAPVGRLLPPSVVRTLAEGDEVTTGREEEVGPAAVRLGYRAATDSAGVQFVLAAPARLDERLLDRRRNDLAMFLLFALALGALGALWAAGAASRQLSRPIRELRESALAIARGTRSPTLREDPPLEFTPVFMAFRQMTTDLAQSREALETAERRLAATLRSVASGVLAVDEGDRVTFANPRAEAVLEVPLAVGSRLPAAAQALLGAVLDEFRSGGGDEGGVEIEHRGRRLSVRLTRLSPGSRRMVVTLDDVTEVTRAERVLAWGEMARQVAHEIKNPLTPMRLGMQHLRRARLDARVDFDKVLEENTARILKEIDRLDEIARAFSRYGTAPVDEAAPESVDVGAVARDVLELERMGQTDVQWEGEIPAEMLTARARPRELREVLLNLLENARLAGARRVVLAVRPREGGGVELCVTDDGSGIPAHLLERIFEPHFSTRTSGSGLGLAVSRRIIDSWGGTISAENRVGGGAELTVRLAPVIGA